MKYTAKQLKDWQALRANGKPDRGQNTATLWQRIKHGWMVVIGCYDVVHWEQ